MYFIWFPGDIQRLRKGVGEWAQVDTGFYWQTWLLNNKRKRLHWYQTTYDFCFVLSERPLAALTHSSVKTGCTAHKISYTEMHYSKFKPLSSVCVVTSMLMYDNELPFTELLRQDKWKRTGRNWTHVIWQKSNLHQTSVSVTLKSTFSQKHFFFFLFLRVKVWAPLRRMMND